MTHAENSPVQPGSLSALGGLCNYYIMSLIPNKVVGAMLSAVLFIVGLRLGIVVGLDGTLWD